jgi:hypothetical protein
MSHRPAITDALLLETSITRSFAGALRGPEMWTGHYCMQKALESVRKCFDNPVSSSSDRRIADSVAAFRKTRRVPNFIALKYICLGAGQLSNQWCVLGEPELREILLFRACEGTLRAQLKCFQGLLRSYFTFARDDEEVPVPAVEGWMALRHWLSQQFASLSDALGPGAQIPEWFRFLGSHANLLTAAPCEAYGLALEGGSAGVLQEVRAGLSIPQDSWLWEEALLSRVRQVVRLADAPFQDSIDRVLGVIFSAPELRISRRLAARCVALLVSRYARCASRLECMPLRDAAISSIGNPWLRRQAWDAYVRDAAGKPDAAARELILGWLRRGLIKDFFELLSEDRAAEPRRLQYWLRFEPVIEDMWFILGSQARRSSQAEYVDFRARAQSRVLRLSGQTPPTNNAFVMRIGNALAVEFGQNNNACFLFAWEQLPKAVASKLASGADHLEVDIENLRGGIKLVHRDSPRAEESWEDKFDQTIVPIFGYSPFQRPLPQPRDASPPAASASFRWTDVERLAQKYNLRTEDRRSRGGAYWVLSGNEDENLTRELRGWGFRYRTEKGWWRE